MSTSKKSSSSSKSKTDESGKKREHKSKESGEREHKSKSSSKKEGGSEHKSKSSSKDKASEGSKTSRSKESSNEKVLTEQLSKVQSELEELKSKHEKEISELKKSYEEKISTLGSGGSEVKKENENPFDPKSGKVIKFEGEWKSTSAGGSLDNLSWRYNPQIFIRPSRTTAVTIKLSQPESSTYTGIGWYIFESLVPESRRLLIAESGDVLAKGGFSKAETVEKTIELKKSKNPYILLVCTYEAEVEMPFTVTLEADAPITAQLISKEQEWPQPTILGEWTGESAGGCANFETFPKNPQYLMKITKQCQMQILLLQEKFEEFDNISIYVVEIESDRTQKITERSVVKDKSKLVVSPEFKDGNAFSASLNIKPGSYAIIPCTFEAGNEAPFKLMVMTEELIPSIRELADAACLSVNGVWSGETAGGCLNDVRSWRGNVQYQLEVKKDVEVTIKVKQTSAIGTADLASVGFYILTGGRRIVRPKKKNIFYKSKFGKKNDGISGKVKLSASEDPYIVVPCTFDEGSEGAYTLQVFSDDPSFIEHVSLGPLPQERDLQKLQAKGEWDGPTAGGCLNYVTWRNNPQFLLDIGKSCEITIFLTVKTERKDIQPGYYVVGAPNTTNIRVHLKPDEVLFKCPFREGTAEVVKTHKFEPGRYNIIPCTYEIGQEARFEITVYVSEFGICELKPIPAGILTLRGEWTSETAGGCINDMKSWLNNPHYFVAVKQAVEMAAVLIQSPGENVPLDDLMDIGFYITNSDGDGNPKTNEENDLITKTNFSPDKDIVSVSTIPACHWPYVFTPSTFKPGLTGKFEIQLLMDKESLEYVEFSKIPMNINPAEVIGAGEDPQIREIRRRFKGLAARTVELVEITEKKGKIVPEFMTYIGRTLLSSVAQFQDSVVSWADGTEPAWWTEGYDEEYVEEEQAGGSAPPPPGGPPPPPGPAPKLPPVNFSKPVKGIIVDSGRQSAMTSEMIKELEDKPKNFVDELLQNITSGFKSLKKVEIPPKPVVQDPLVCAFNLEILNKRRAAIEGLHDNEEDEAWTDDEWDEKDD